MNHVFGSSTTLEEYLNSKAIDTTLGVSPTQWNYIKALDQSISTSSAVQFSLVQTNSFNTDLIQEKTTDNGISIDGVLLKDSNMTSIANITAQNAVITDTTESTTHDTGALVLTEGGLGVQKNITSNQTVKAVSLSDGTANLSNGVLSNASNIQAMKMSGFGDWAGTGDYWSFTGPTTFNLLRGGTGYIKSNPITFSGGQSVAITANAVNLVYINSSGVLLRESSISSSLYENNIVLFEILLDDLGNIFVKKETHPHCFSTKIAEYLHWVVGTVFGNSSTLGIATPTTIESIGSDTLWDHGLQTSITATDPILINYFYTNALGKWTLHASTTTVPAVYNNAGSVEILTSATKRSVYRLYGVLDNLNSSAVQWMAVIHTAEFSNLATAIDAINSGIIAHATNEIENLEPAQMGYIVVNNNVIEQIIIQKRTMNEAYSGGMTSSSHLLLSDLDSGLYLDGNHTNLIPLVKNADTNPGVNDDITTYKEGTVWVNETTNEVFINTNNADGAAVWMELGSTVYTDLVALSLNTMKLKGKGTSFYFGNTIANASTSDDYNVAFCDTALQNTVTGAYNIAIGNAALNALTESYYCIGLGQNAGDKITTGNGNICIGNTSGDVITTGYGNICLGLGANVGALDVNAQERIAIGLGAINSIDKSIQIGSGTLTGMKLGSSNTLTPTKLNEVIANQDVAITSSPEFSGLTVTGNQQAIFRLMDTQETPYPYISFRTADHDSVSLSFNSYYDGANWKSSSALGNYLNDVGSGTVNFRTAYNNAVGGNIGWFGALSLNLSSGAVIVGDTLEIRNGASNKHSITSEATTTTRTMVLPDNDIDLSNIAALSYETVHATKTSFGSLSFTSANYYYVPFSATANDNKLVVNNTGTYIVEYDVSFYGNNASVTTEVLDFAIFKNPTPYPSTVSNYQVGYVSASNVYSQCGLTADRKQIHQQVVMSLAANDMLLLGCYNLDNQTTGSVYIIAMSMVARQIS